MLYCIIMLDAALLGIRSNVDFQGFTSHDVERMPGNESGSWEVRSPPWCAPPWYAGCVEC